MNRAKASDDAEIADYDRKINLKQQEIQDLVAQQRELTQTPTRPAPTTSAPVTDPSEPPVIPLRDIAAEELQPTDSGTDTEDEYDQLAAFTVETLRDPEFWKRYFTTEQKLKDFSRAYNEQLPEMEKHDEAWLQEKSDDVDLDFTSERDKMIEEIVDEVSLRPDLYNAALQQVYAQTSDATGEAPSPESTGPAESTAQDIVESAVETATDPVAAAAVRRRKLSRAVLAAIEDTDPNNATKAINLFDFLSVANPDVFSEAWRLDYTDLVDFDSAVQKIMNVVQDDPTRMAMVEDALAVESYDEPAIQRVLRERQEKVAKAISQLQAMVKGRQARARFEIEKAQYLKRRAELIETLKTIKQDLLAGETYAGSQPRAEEAKRKGDEARERVAKLVEENRAAANALAGTAQAEASESELSEIETNANELGADLFPDSDGGPNLFDAPEPEPTFDSQLQEALQANPTGSIVDEVLTNNPLNPGDQPDPDAAENVDVQTIINLQRQIAELKLQVAQSAGPDPNISSVVAGQLKTRLSQMQNALTQALAGQTESLRLFQVGSNAAAQERSRAANEIARGTTAAVTGLRTDKQQAQAEKQAQKYLPADPAAAAAAAAELDEMKQRYPRAMRVYERGLIPLDKARDKDYMGAMEQRLKSREELLGDPKFGTARTALRPGQYARVKRQSDGIGRYHRPRFATSPYFTG